jgi:hypothetical protein
MKFTFQVPVSMLAVCRYHFSSSLDYSFTSPTRMLLAWPELLGWSTATAEDQFKFSRA